MLQIFNTFDKKVYEKFSKISVAVCLTSILLLSNASDAEARKFWGLEKEIDVTAADQDGDILETSSYYVLWIKVKSREETIRCCP